MTRKTLIALVAAAALTVGFAASAQAKTNVNIDFGINLGGNGYYDNGYGYGDYGAGYDDDEDSCGWQLVKKIKWNWNHTHKIVKWKKVWTCY